MTSAIDALRVGFCREHQGMRGVADVPGATEIINACDGWSAIDLRCLARVFRLGGTDAIIGACQGYTVYDLQTWSRVIDLASERMEEKPPLVPVPVPIHPEDEEVARFFEEPQQ